MQARALDLLRPRLLARRQRDAKKTEKSALLTAGMLGSLGEGWRRLLSRSERGRVRRRRDSAAIALTPQCWRRPSPVGARRGSKRLRGGGPARGAIAARRIAPDPQAPRRKRGASDGAHEASREATACADGRGQRARLRRRREGKRDKAEVRGRAEAHAEADADAPKAQRLACEARCSTREEQPYAQREREGEQTWAAIRDLALK